MNNIIIQTIRAGVVLGIAFFAFVDSAFAAPTLAPAAVSNITKDSATLDGYVTNSGRNSIVWFEWSEGNSVSAPNITTRYGLYNAGPFVWTLRGLTPGVVYSYRSAAMDEGVIAYSPPMSFKTLSTVTNVSEITTYQQGQTSSPLGSVTYNQSTPQPPATTQASTQTPAQTNTNQVPVVEKKNTEATVSVEKTDGFTNTSINSNAAAVAGIGGGVLPGTLIGWIALLIAILVMLLVALIIYEGVEKRRIAIEEKKKLKTEEENKEREVVEGK